MNEESDEAPGTPGRPPAYANPVPREAIDRLGPVVLKACLRIADHLDLSRGERLALLGLPGEAELPAPDGLSDEQFYRLSYIVGIWLDVGARFGSRDAIVHWLKAPCHDQELAGRNVVEYLIEEGLPGFDYIRRDTAYWACNGW